MTTARDIMTSGAECVGENETLVAAARKMRDLDVGSLPICGEDNRLKGMVTGRAAVLSMPRAATTTFGWGGCGASSSHRRWKPARTARQGRYVRRWSWRPHATS